MADWEQTRDRLRKRSGAMLVSSADAWEKQTGADIRAALERVEELERALGEIEALQPEQFVFLADWHEQIKACADCQRYKDHPIQQGICDLHRKPLWARDAHDADELRRLGPRAKGLARAALAAERGE